MPLFNDNASLIYPPHPGFVSGKYYASTFSSGTANNTLLVGFVYYTYFFVPIQQSFNRVAFYSNTGFSNQEEARFAIYKVSSGLPSSLVADLGTISFTTSGLKEISCFVSLAPGWYAVALQFNPAQIGISSPSINLGSLLGQTSPTLTSFSGLRATLAYGSFPLTASLVNAIDTNSPLIWLKAA